jgi:hypothetical protein
VEEVIREGTWKCPNCGATNRGRDVKCPGCGQARENVAFEYDAGAAAVTDASEIAVATAGGDWVCGYCGTSNRSGQPRCRQCNADRAEGKQRPETDVSPGPASAPDLELPAPSTFAASARYLFFGLLAALVGLAILATRTSESRLTLSKAHWERGIAIEKLGPVTREDWQGSVPAGARVLSRFQAIHHHVKVATGTRAVERTYSDRVQRGTRRVKVGTRDLGNGYFKDIYEERPVYETVTRQKTVMETVYRSDPVFRTRVRYEIDAWRPHRDVKTSGDDTTPVWGEVKLSPGEREGKRSARYTVELSATGGSRYDHEPEEPVFARLRLGSTYRVEVSGLGRVRRILDMP